MEILDKKTLCELFKIVKILDDGIELENFFGVIAEMPSSIDAKYVHELENIVNEIKNKNDNYIILDKESIKDFYFIPKKEIESKIQIANKDEYNAVAYLPLDKGINNLVYLNRHLMNDEEVKETGIMYLTRSLGLKDIRDLEQYCENNANKKLKEKINNEHN